MQSVNFLTAVQPANQPTPALLFKTFFVTAWSETNKLECLTQARFIQPSPIFLSKDGAYFSVETNNAPLCVTENNGLG